MRTGLEGRGLSLGHLHGLPAFPAEFQGFVELRSTSRTDIGNCGSRLRAVAGGRLRRLRQVQALPHAIYLGEDGGELFLKVRLGLLIVLVREFAEAVFELEI